MPKVKAGNLILHYEQQGAGDPLILIPFYRRSRQGGRRYVVGRQASRHGAFTLPPQSVDEDRQLPASRHPDLPDRRQITEQCPEMVVSHYSPGVSLSELYVEARLHSTVGCLRAEPPGAVARSFMLQSDAVLRHDVAQVSRIQAPTLCITFGRQMSRPPPLTFAPIPCEGNSSVELVIFERCSTPRCTRTSPNSTREPSNF
mgnify:CR=1 FL=1